MDRLSNYGRVGSFLLGSDDELYGVTSDHVTSQSTDGFLYIQKDTEELIQFGRVVQSPTLSNIKTDINIFKVNKDLQRYCLNNYCNASGQPCVPKYFYNIPSLYEKVLFAVTCEKNTSDVFNCEVKHGRVLSRNIHSEYEIGEEHFLVEEIKNKPFFKGGDSGNIVSCQAPDGNVVLVGIIIGKYEKSRNISKTCKSNLVLCLNWKKGIDHMETIFKRKFLRPPDPPKKQTFFLTTGMRIYIKMIERPPQDCDFELHEKLINLTDLLVETISNDNDIFWRESRYMLTLSKHVNNRTDVEPSDYPTVDHRCYLFAIQGCDHLFSGHVDLAEKQMKESVKLVAKTSVPYRLLCKIITYTTWLLLKQNKLAEMREVLSYGFIFTLKFKDHDVRIHDSIGYLYFDLARYYIQKEKIVNALCMAYKSKECFENFEKGGGKCLEKQALTWSLIARLSLNCGEYLQRLHFDPYDIQEAEHYTKKLKCHLTKLPIVQTVSYFMVKTDLFIRKRMFVDALVSANKSLELSKEYELKEELLKTRIKLKFLQQQ